MSDCSEHKKEVAGISDMKVLAEMIGDLHYETLSELLNELYLKLNQDGVKDCNAGRRYIGAHLIHAADSISEASASIHLTWQISKRFMK